MIDPTAVRATIGANGRRLEGGLAGPGATARRVAIVEQPTRVWFADGRSRVAAAGTVLPLAKGGLAGQVTHAVVDGPFAGGHLFRHRRSYRVGTDPWLREGTR